VYPATAQQFRAFLEVLFAIFIIAQSYYIYKSIRRKLDNYRTWYSLYVEFFPAIMKEQRDRKKPKILRRMEYILDFGEILDIVNISVLALSLIGWIIYVVQTH